MTQKPYTPVVTQWFWELLEASNRNLAILAKKLERLEREELRQFGLQYDEAKWDVNICYCEEYWPFMDGGVGCSEDHGDDFAAWVVSMGREFYDDLIANREKVKSLNDIYCQVEMDRMPEMGWNSQIANDEYQGYQRPDFIASAIFRSRFDKSFRKACYDNRGWPREVE